MLKGMLCFQSNSNFRLSKGIHPPFVRNQFVLLLQQPLTRVLLYFVILQQNLHYRGRKLLHAVRSCSSLAICAAQHTVPQPGYSLHLLYSTTIAHLRERLLQMPSNQGFVLNLQIGILFFFQFYFLPGESITGTHPEQLTSSLQMDPSTALHKDMKRTSQTPGPEPMLVTEHKRRAKGSFSLFAQQTLSRSKFRCDNKPVLIMQLMGFSAT